MKTEEKIHSPNWTFWFTQLLLSHRKQIFAGFDVTTSRQKDAAPDKY